jgi:hypothetical protein
MALCTQGAQSKSCLLLSATFTSSLALVHPINFSSDFATFGNCSWTRAFVPPKLNPKRASFVLSKIDEILAWVKNSERDRDTRFVELGAAYVKLGPANTGG